MKYHVEQFTGRTWKRVVSDLTSLAVAENMKQALADRNGIDIDNYSILITEG